ncbi:MAG: aminoacyl-tRNA hydrolase [Bacteroidia bacterium]|nr:aminoacyl-tRNA hydrolase [Bacteroidia bacterium]
MKYLIAGLGNIGSEYEGTRHNIGFMVVKHMLKHFDKTAESNRYGQTALVKHKGRQIHLLMPSTYMNLSGKAVRFHLEKQKIPIENLMVITDDLALPFGKLRLRGKGSDGGHNGLKHIQEQLKTSAYPRLKFGISNNFPKGQQVRYVLERFSEEEESLLPELLEKSMEMVLAFSTIGLARTMSNFNGK